MSPFVTFLAQATEQAVAQATPVANAAKEAIVQATPVMNAAKEAGISPIVVYLAALLVLILGGLVVYQLSAIATATREMQDNTAKSAVLLTVLANKQGASEDDVKKAMGK
mgnify:CR=1 FL=1